VKRYQAAEQAVRSAKNGMWVLSDQYESPRDYRRHVGISQ
jgi:endonuclease YncB( thermonuclease family)